MEGIRQITPYLSAMGVDTTVVSLDTPDETFLHDQPFQAVGLGPVIGSYGYRPALPSRIRAFAEDHDAVIIHGIWQYHSYATWRALRDTSIPYFVYPHGMLDPWFKRAYPLKHLKKRSYWHWADYRVLRDARAVLFTTDQERLLARESFSLYKAMEKVVGYGTTSPPSDIDSQSSAFLKHYPHLKGKRIFLFLGRIHPKKGVDLLIEAFASVVSTDSRLHLVIAGPDQVGWKFELEQRAEALGICDRITWTGMLSGQLKWGAFRCAELFCLPSHQENFGIVVAEALACGLPVSIADSVNISGDIQSSNAGLVNKDTLDGTINGLLIWLSLSPTERSQMISNSLELFRSRYDFASISQKLFTLLFT